MKADKIRPSACSGVDGSFGENMGISNDWAYHIIRTVGNYSETFERNVGKATPPHCARGQRTGRKVVCNMRHRFVNA